MIQRQDIKNLAVLFGRFTKPYWRSLTLLIIVSMTAGFLMSLRPLILAPAMDAALLSSAQPAASISEINLNNLGATVLAWVGMTAGVNTFHLLLVIVLLFIGIVVISAWMNFLTLQLMRWVRTGVANDMQSAMYKHILSLSMPFFVKQRGGEMPNRFVLDVVQTAQSFDPIIRGLFESMIQIVIYGIILIKTDKYMAITVGGVILLQMAITRYLQYKVRSLTVQSFDTYSRIGSLVQETVQTIRVVKSFCAERFEHSRLMQELRGLKLNSLMFGFYQNSEIPLRDSANGMAVGAILLVAFNSLSANRLTPSGFVMFVLVASQAIIPFSKLGEALVQLQIFLGASTRVREIFSLTPALPDGNVDATPFTSSICLEKVSFSYDSGAAVLDDVNLEIRRGAMVAIVGPSGAGKSSLVDLILRLYDPTSGTVTYNGMDIRHYREESYRCHFGVVPQECLLFNSNITENIAYGRTVEMDEVKRAARIANAEEFIQQFPEAYETMVGDRGIRLSGGQRQRIAIARAVYGHPEILILDEATSSLDSESEKQVQAAIDQVTKGITAIVIAHRLSTVIMADTIVVLNEGKVEAIGTHSVLLETSPLYRRLYTAQFREEVPGN
jgi:ABC-type multidrug transport system fused ATPase/permease subunit